MKFYVYLFETLIWMCYWLLLLFKKKVILLSIYFYFTYGIKFPKQLNVFICSIISLFITMLLPVRSLIKCHHFTFVTWDCQTTFRNSKSIKIPIRLLISKKPMNDSLSAMSRHSPWQLKRHIIQGYSKLFILFKMSIILNNPVLFSNFGMLHTQRYHGDVHTHTHTHTHSCLLVSAPCSQRLSCVLTFRRHTPTPSSRLLNATIYGIFWKLQRHEIQTIKYAVNFINPVWVRGRHLCEMLFFLISSL
jgi:hypothetical protein